MPRPHLLLVDDDPGIARVVIRLLRDVCDIEHEGSPERALRRIEAGERFDALILDLNMPEMSGAELHWRVAAIAPDLAAHTLFVSGDLDTPRFATLLAGTKARKLPKPFAPQELREAVSETLKAA